MEITHRIVPQQAKAAHADLNRLAGQQLAPGASGPAVESLQRLLAGLNLYSGPINGTYDAATTAAVKQLEAQAKIATPDGAFGGAELKEVKSRELFVKDGFQTPARVGQKGADVKKLEAKLHDLGYAAGTQDGIYDSKLERAVKSFRKDEKSVPDQFHGAGKLVWRGLNREIHGLEANLTKLGRHPGKVDSSFTDKTAAAVKAFQKKHDLKPTGLANDKTRNAIAREANDGMSAATKKFIDVAKAQQGDPYVFGAQGPNAFDCSGLIYYALKQAGVSGSRTTADGYMDRYAKNKVSRENLKPGDLVFYYYPNTRGISPGNASHIEIYLGHGKTMGTDNPSEGARVENIDWNAFIGGARVPGLQ